MEEGKEVEAAPGRGNEWEVVSLTASTYAAAPGPNDFESNDNNRGSELNIDEEKTSHAMFMSRHFVFPPGEHENLPIEPDASEIWNEPVVEDVNLDDESGMDQEQGDRSGKSKEENWNIEEVIGSNDLHGIEFFDDGKGKGISGQVDFETGKVLHGLSLVGEEHIKFSADNFSSFREEEGVSGSTVSLENLVIPDLSNPSQFNLESSSEFPKPQSPTDENKYKGSGLPSEAWWKRRVASLYAQAKEANAFWSVFVAAALMGLVIIGQRWQQERWQMQQLKWQFSVSDEKINWMLTPISRFKEAIAGGQRRGSVIRSGASADR